MRMLWNYFDILRGIYSQNNPEEMEYLSELGPQLIQFNVIIGSQHTYQ